MAFLPAWGTENVPYHLARRGRKREEGCNSLLVPPSTTPEFLSPPCQVACSLNERESGKTEEGSFTTVGSGKT